MKVKTRTQVTLDLSTEEVAFLRLIATYYKNTNTPSTSAACQRLISSLPWVDYLGVDFDNAFTSE